jgi:hypothetical protein
MEESHSPSKTGTGSIGSTCGGSEEEEEDSTAVQTHSYRYSI